LKTAWGKRYLKNRMKNYLKKNWDYKFVKKVAIAHCNWTVPMR
jgi:hypothetical protein